MEITGHSGRLIISVCGQNGTINFICGHDGTVDITGRTIPARDACKHYYGIRMYFIIINSHSELK